MSLKQALRKARALNKKFHRSYLVSFDVPAGRFRVDSDIHCSCWPRVVWQNTHIYKLIT